VDGDWEIGTDIGGTFTDIIALHVGTSETRIAKVPSRPDDPVRAMLEAIDAVGAFLGFVNIVVDFVVVLPAIILTLIPEYASFVAFMFELPIVVDEKLSEIKGPAISSL